ncbi:MAG: two-component sensor histidine kinase [Acidimicrobiaceae bacterium]|nr:two-component sensor histidine kinase [Acidimicrobiaceae bacterium]
MWQVIVVAVSVVVGVFVGWRLHSGVAARRTERPTAASLSPAFATPSPPPAAEVIEALRLGVAMSGKDGAGEFRNAAARAMTLDHLALDDAIERHLARGLAGLRSEEVVELEGSPKAVYVVHSTALPNGGSVVFVDDVSERRRIDRVRTDFVANVSHELKTPIGAISVLAETLQDEDDLTTVGRLATRLLGEAERAANTIDDLMELSRIELGGDRVTHPVSVARIVGDAVERVRELADQRSITIVDADTGADRADRADLRVDGDARQLTSALGNLVENAVKYSHDGGVVEVRVRPDDATIAIDVVDRGIGIAPGDVERVFERFYRVDPARSRATGGTGLGLAIVRHVVTQHGGEVTVESTQGSGSTFTLHLPAAHQTSADTDEPPTR